MSDKYNAYKKNAVSTEKYREEYDRIFKRTCPRCKGQEFDEIDCDADDMYYDSWKCKNCGLWFDGWVRKWFVDCYHWKDAQWAEEYK